MLETPMHPLEDCDADIARLYLKTADNQLKKISAAVRSKSTKKIQRLAHNLCGASAFLGLKDMASLLSDLEKAASRGHTKEASHIIGSVKEEFSHVQRQCGLRNP